MGFSWTRARTPVPRIGREILNHCTTREVPGSFLDKFSASPVHLGSHLPSFFLQLFSRVRKTKSLNIPIQSPKHSSWSHVHSYCWTIPTFLSVAPSRQTLLLFLRPQDSSLPMATSLSEQQEKSRGYRWGTHLCALQELSPALDGSPRLCNVVFRS